MPAVLPLFPVFLKLEGRRVLLVGGGRVAAAKLEALRRAGATVTIVAPDVLPSIRKAAPHVRIRRRPFRPSDLTGHWLVVSAATPEVNRLVSRVAERRRVFVNAVDDPSNASAYLGGVLARGGVTVAISTNGRAPAVAGLLREGLDALLPPDLDRWLRTSDRLRRTWRANGVPMDERRPQLLAALNRLAARPSAAVANGKDAR